MTTTPYPIGGTVKDIDASTLVEGATVIVKNATKGTQLSTTTNSIGEWLIDLANFTGATPYADNDVIYVIIDYPNRYEHYRTTVDTAVGAETKNLILRAGSNPASTSQFNYGGCRLYAGTISNASGGALTVDLYEIESDTRKCRFQVPTVSSHSFHYGKMGLEFRGGILVLTGGTGGAASETTMVTLVYS